MKTKSIRHHSKTKSRDRFNLTVFLHQYGFLFFILFFAFVLWAFWSSYYGTILQQHSLSVRLHASAMTLWCLMLISQGLLIRTKHLTAHRLIGKFSYILVPFIIWSGAHLAYQTIIQAPAGTNAYYYMIALMYNSLILFSILYILAMWHRKKSHVHARYMACTVFPLITPVTDRLIYKYFDGLIPLAPTMVDGMPMVPAIGFALVDMFLLFLIVWDWLKHRHIKVFPAVLIMLVVYQISVLTFYKYGFWKIIGDQFMKLPV